MRHTVDCPQWNDLQELARPRTPPCVSVYLSTLAGRPGARSAAGRLHHLLESASKTLVEQGWGGGREGVLAPAYSLCDDRDFWAAVDDGLAILLETGRWTKFRLAGAVRDDVCVASHFRLMPLVAVAAENEPFLLLSLSRNEVRLWEGDHDALSPVALPDLAGGMRNILNYDRPESPRQVRSTVHHPTRHAVGAVFHGQGAVTAHDEQDLVAYFRRIDEILHPLLVGDQRPLVVAAVDDECAVYQAVATYPHVLPDHVSGSPDRWSADDVHRLAVEVVARQRAALLRDALASASRRFGGDPAWSSFSAVIDAAEMGRIDTLFVAGAAEPVAGRWRRRVAPPLARRHEAEVERAALATLAHGGRVYFVPPQQLPRRRGLLPSLRCASAGAV